MGNLLCGAKDARQDDVQDDDGAPEAGSVAGHVTAPAPEAPTAAAGGLPVPQPDCDDGIKPPDEPPAVLDSALSTMASSTMASVLPSASAIAPGASIVTTMQGDGGTVTWQSPEQMVHGIQVMEFIGSGASGVVYKGSHHGEDVAIKVVPARANLDKRLLREIMLSMQLRHPNVVRTHVVRGAELTSEFIAGVFGGGMDAKRASASAPVSQVSANLLSKPPCTEPLATAEAGRQGWRSVLVNACTMPNRCLIVFVQEHCSGGSLTDAMKRGLFRHDGAARSTRVLRHRMLLRTMAEVCRGMHFLHSMHVVHGDLKPANVLLARSRADKRGFTAKVADFGLARMLPDGMSRVESTETGTTVYMSPESFLGQHSKASDVWSFGVLLNEAMTGQRPYINLNAAQVMMGVACEDLRPAWPEAEWPELSALGARCLASQPGERPTFAELERELLQMEAQLRARSCEEWARTVSAASGRPCSRRDTAPACKALSSETGGAAASADKVTATGAPAGPGEQGPSSRASRAKGEP